MADREDDDQLLTQFSSVTGTDAERAKFYLSMSGWDLQIALSSFYDTQQDNIISDDENDEDYKPAMDAPPKKPTTRKGNERITTFSSLNKDDEEDSDDEEGQAFYAGGSEHSGQQIIGPPRKKNEKSSDVTQNIFDAAKRHGAEVVDPAQEEEEEGKNRKSSAFRGSGYRLGETDHDSTVVNSASSNSLDTEPIAVDLTFWSNGFSVDNGPLRDTSGAENKEFLDSVKRGEIPRELLRLNRGGEVHVNMMDKRNEEYVQPKQIIKAFSGAGHTLGSPVPNVVSTNQNNTRAGDQPSNSPATLNLDDTAPVTNLQIRLADGTRLVTKFNHSHTISDVRKFVAASRPQAAGRHFVLMTTFPNKELTEERKTLEEAKLLNAVIVQRYK